MPDAVIRTTGSERESDEVGRLRIARDEALSSAQASMLDTMRLMRVLTLLDGTDLQAVVLDRVLATLSETFLADVVVLVDPGGTGTLVPLAAIGLPEDCVATALAGDPDSPLRQALRTGLPGCIDAPGGIACLDGHLRALDVCSAVWLPVAGSHGPRGALLLARCRHSPFSRTEVGLLRVMASRIGVALEQAQRRSQLEGLVRAGERLSGCLDRAAVADEAVRGLAALVRADAAALILSDAPSGNRCVARHGFAPRFDPLWCRIAHRLFSGTDRAAHALLAESGLRELVASLPGDPDLACPAEAMLAIPIRGGSGVDGALVAMRSGANAFTPDALQIATLHAGLVGAALENARFYETLHAELTTRKRLNEDLGAAKRQVEELLAVRDLQLTDANRRLLDQAREYQELYDAAPCGYHSLAVDGTFLRVNATECRMLGYAPEEMVGRMNIRDVLAPQGGYLVPERRRDLRCSFVRRDGSVFPGVLSESPVYDAAGRLASTRAVLLDDSERARSERQIAALNIELERRAIAAEAASRAKTRFLATMSHEVRTPLNAIVGMTELLRRRDHDPRNLDRLDKIRAASMHLLSLLSDVLDVARIDASEEFALTERDFDFDVLIRRVVDSVATRARDKGLAFMQDQGRVPRLLHGDAQRLEGVLLKLLDNAIKFTAIGSITFRYRVVEEAAGQVLLRFEVEDTGIGIAPEDVGRLFEVFEQGDNTSTRRFGGTGLGLAIVRRLARLMGGDAGVVSEPGRGSSFWVTLRVRTAAVAEAGARPAEALLRESCAGTCLLVVEDDEFNSTVLGELLRFVDIGCEVAEDGIIAVEMAARRDYPLILMDVRLPRMDGLEATRRIRALAAHASTPIVAVTANAFASDRDECLKAGMNDFLAKPVDPEDLYLTLARWLQPRATGARLRPG